VLSTKYRSYWTFISNRFLRIFPTYYAILLTSIVVSVVARVVSDNWLMLGGWAQYWGQVGTPWRLFFIITNAVVLGQDWYFFLGVNPDGTPTIIWDRSLMRLMGIVPTAWALSLILMFYLIAPYLSGRSSRFLAAVVAGSLALRALFVWGGLYIDPWTYRFFPNEVGLFAAGMLSYRWYRGGRLERLGNGFALLVCLTFLAYALAYNSLAAIPQPLRWGAYFTGLFLALPFFYMRGNGSGWDRCLGRLSFPAYLVHQLLADSLGLALFFTGSAVPQFWVAFSVSAASTVAAAAILRFIEDPVEMYRRGRAESTGGAVGRKRRKHR
jgi:peptidoglycan/LPS O-acetylase OafA/YrhL